MGRQKKTVRNKRKIGITDYENDIIDTIESIINMFLFIVKFKKINGININRIKDVMRHSLLFPA